jgi:hypothetical protein
MMIVASAYSSKASWTFVSSSPKLSVNSSSTHTLVEYLLALVNEPSPGQEAVLPSTCVSTSSPRPPSA